MKPDHPEFPAPQDADARKTIAPVICYPPDTLPAVDLAGLSGLRAQSVSTDSVTVPPRDARCITVPAGCFFCISSVQGSQVGDLNLWNAHDLTERFYSGKTRALHPGAGGVFFSHLVREGIAGGRSEPVERP